MMFNKKIKPQDDFKVKFKLLDSQIRELRRRVWQLENHPKFQIGQKVLIGPVDWDYKECEILGINWESDSNRAYYIRYYDGTIISLEEYEIDYQNSVHSKKIKTNT